MDWRRWTVFLFNLESHHRKLNLIQRLSMMALLLMTQVEYQISVPVFTAICTKPNIVIIQQLRSWILWATSLKSVKVTERWELYRKAFQRSNISKLITFLSRWPFCRILSNFSVGQICFSVRSKNNIHSYCSLIIPNRVQSSTVFSPALCLVQHCVQCWTCWRPKLDQCVEPPILIPPYKQSEGGVL